MQLVANADAQARRDAGRGAAASMAAASRRSRPRSSATLDKGQRDLHAGLLRVSWRRRPRRADAGRADRDDAGAAAGRRRRACSAIRTTSIKALLHGLTGPIDGTDLHRSHDSDGAEHRRVDRGDRVVRPQLRSATARSLVVAGGRRARARGDRPRARRRGRSPSSRRRCRGRWSSIRGGSSTASHNPAIAQQRARASSRGRQGARSRPGCGSRSSCRSRRC